MKKFTALSLAILAMSLGSVGMSNQTPVAASRPSDNSVFLPLPVHEPSVLRAIRLYASVVDACGGIDNATHASERRKYIRLYNARVNSFSEHFNSMEKYNKKYFGTMMLIDALVTERAPGHKVRAVLMDFTIYVLNNLNSVELDIDLIENTVTANFYMNSIPDIVRGILSYCTESIDIDGNCISYYF